MFITTLRNACKMEQKHLTLTEEKFRNLIELATDGILIGSNRGVIIDANSTFCSMIEMCKEDIIGLFIADLPFTKESVGHTPFRFDLLRSGQLVISERELIKSDGNKITIEMRTKMMPDGTYQSIYRDISDRKRYELQLLNYAAELSKLNADKDHFISILAHDLVSPFNTILGYLELLISNIDSYDKNEIKEHLGVVDNVSKKTFHLLQEILTWSRTSSGRMSFEPKVVNLKNNCQKTVDILEPLASNKKISIINAIDAEYEVYSDINMLRTIFRNLLSNAIKFTGEEGVIVIDAVRDEANFIKLSVKDTGIGMTNEKLILLFNNVHNTPSEGTFNEKGTGLGLIICKMLVERQGGTISVESEPMKGTTFFVTIPVKDKSLRAKV